MLPVDDVMMMSLLGFVCASFFIYGLIRAFT